jgi:hypothetical protein
MPVFRLLFRGGTKKRMKISFNSDASWRGPRFVSLGRVTEPSLYQGYSSIVLLSVASCVPYMLEYNAQNFVSSYFSKH